MDGGAWWAAVHGVAKSRTRLSNFTFTFHSHALEKEMATHSSVLAWRIPGTAEPGGLPSMGSHRVGHDWSDLAAPSTGWHLCPPQAGTKSWREPANFGKDTNGKKSLGLPGHPRGSLPRVCVRLYVCVCVCVCVCVYTGMTLWKASWRRHCRTWIMKNKHFWKKTNLHSWADKKVETQAASSGYPPPPLHLCQPLVPRQSSHSATTSFTFFPFSHGLHSQGEIFAS